MWEGESVSAAYIAHHRGGARARSAGTARGQLRQLDFEVLLFAPLVFVAHFIEEGPGFVAWFNAHVTRVSLRTCSGPSTRLGC
jgi:hypothetical protein